MQRNFLFDQGIIKGYTYRFKYRVKNQIGWSDYSESTYILAANVPSKPPTPTYVSSTSTEISLQFYEPADNGGSLITLYELEMNDGTGYAPVNAYD
jgi:hypothetical protein